VKAPRVLLAEDNLLLREGVVQVLTSHDVPVVGVVHHADDVLAAVERLHPDLLLTDVRMPPGMSDDGLRVALAARRRHPDMAVLVLSQYVEDAYLADLTALGTGGIGYLLKQRVASIGEFLDAVRRVAAGGTAFDPEVVAQLLHARRDTQPMRRLTSREHQVLELMAAGLSNTAIAGRLTVSLPAVEKHIRSILAKLDLPPDDEGHRRVLAVLSYLRSNPAG
jgi:DNA-binding NarL/FixJ family response regulator